MTLQHVDTVIAFAVIMLGASLLIMLLTQAISTLLNLRGDHLRRALRDLLMTLYFKPEQMARADAITREILQHPLLSDSSFGSNDPADKRTWYRWPAAIGAAAVCGVAIGALVVVPDYIVGAGVFAAVVAGGLVYYFSKNWELASAVRVQEFFGMLEKLGQTEANTDVGKAMTELSKKIREDSGLNLRLEELKALGDKCRKGIEELAAELRKHANDPAVDEVLEALLARIGGTAERKARIVKLRATVNANFHAVADRLGELAIADLTIESDTKSLMTKMQEAAESGLRELETLFNAAMDRAAQRFALHSRVWTVAFSVAFAFIVHLDAIELFKRLSSDAELRAKLVASSDAMMKQADKIITSSANDAGAATMIPSDAGVATTTPNDAGSAPEDAGASAQDGGAFPAPVQSAAAAVSTANTAASEAAACLARENLKPRVPNIYTAALLCPKKLAFSDAERKKLGPFPTREDALDYLSRRPPESTPDGRLPDRDEDLDQFRENLSTLLQSSEQSQLFDHAASINGQLSRAGLELWPDPYPGIWPSRKELPGLLVAAALLSLGAPFWFNVLKTLGNLRPLVATREEKERQDKGQSKEPAK